MSEYYILRDGERLGPFDEATILRDRERGVLRDKDLIWAEGLEDWVPVSAAFAELGKRSAAPLDLQLEALEEPPPDSGRNEDRRRGYRIASEDPMADIPPAGAFAFDYAGFWVRFGAVVIDGMIVWLVVVGLGIAVLLGWQLVSPQATPEQLSENAFPVLLVNLLGLIIPWLYYARLEGGPRSATLGKRVFNLEVRFAHDLEPFGFLIGTARYGVSIISALLLFIGYLIQPFTARKQALHDLATGTVVIVRDQYSRLLLGVVIALPFLALAAFIVLTVFIGAVEQGWL